MNSMNVIVLVTETERRFFLYDDTKESYHALLSVLHKAAKIKQITREQADALVHYAQRQKAEYQALLDKACRGKS
jgi:hypothetical protein